MVFFPKFHNPNRIIRKTPTERNSTAYLTITLQNYPNHWKQGKSEKLPADRGLGRCDNCIHSGILDGVLRMLILSHYSGFQELPTFKKLCSTIPNLVSFFVEKDGRQTASMTWGFWRGSCCGVILDKRKTSAKLNLKDFEQWMNCEPDCLLSQSRFRGSSTTIRWKKIYGHWRESDLQKMEGRDRNSWIGYSSAFALSVLFEHSSNSWLHLIGRNSVAGTSVGYSLRTPLLVMFMMCRKTFRLNLKSLRRQL